MTTKYIYRSTMIFEYCYFVAMAYPICKEIGNTAEAQQSCTGYHRKRFAEWQGVNVHE